MNRNLLMQLKPMLIAAFCGAAILPAISAPRRYAVTSEQVAAAMNRTGMQVLPDQVAMMTNVVSSVAAPALKVKSIDRSGDGRTMARLECATAGQCLPFMVALRVGAEPAAASTAQPEQPSHPRPTTPLVHAGSPATLLLEGTHVHITLSVICVENGALGQTVRATSSDRHQSFTAQVVREGVLEGKI